MSQYQLFFKVSDPSGLDDYMDITVPITDVNEKPVIQNLPGDAYIVESLTGTSSVFGVNAVDEDGDPLTYSISTWPDDALFSINGAGEFRITTRILIIYSRKHKPFHNICTTSAQCLRR